MIIFQIGEIVFLDLFEKLKNSVGKTIRNLALPVFAGSAIYFSPFANSEEIYNQTHKVNMTEADFSNVSKAKPLERYVELSANLTEDKLTLEYHLVKPEEEKGIPLNLITYFSNTSAGIFVGHPENLSFGDSTQTIFYENNSGSHKLKLKSTTEVAEFETEMAIKAFDKVMTDVVGEKTVEKFWEYAEEWRKMRGKFWNEEGKSGNANWVVTEYLLHNTGRIIDSKKTGYETGRIFEIEIKGDGKANGTLLCKLDLAQSNHAGSDYSGSLFVPVKFGEEKTATERVGDREGVDREKREKLEKKQLGEIGLALRMHIKDEDDKFPKNFGEAWGETDYRDNNYFLTPENYVLPNSDTTPPKNEQEACNGNGDFLYFGDGKIIPSRGDGSVILVKKPKFWKSGESLYVLYSSGVVKKISKITKDLKANPYDLEKRVQEEKGIIEKEEREKASREEDNEPVLDFLFKDKELTQIQMPANVEKEPNPFYNFNEIYELPEAFKGARRIVKVRYDLPGEGLMSFLWMQFKNKSEALNALPEINQSESYTGVYFQSKGILGMFYPPSKGIIGKGTILRTDEVGLLKEKIAPLMNSLESLVSRTESQVVFVIPANAGGRDSSEPIKKMFGEKIVENQMLFDRGYFLAEFTKEDFKDAMKEGENILNSGERWEIKHASEKQARDRIVFFKTFFPGAIGF